MDFLHDADSMRTRKGKEILGASRHRLVGCALAHALLVLGLLGEWALDVVEVQPILSTGWRAMQERS